jgi:hypothetical protein
MSIYASNQQLITRTEDEIKHTFEITCLGAPKQLLGMEIHCDRERGTITITQTNYIKKILSQHSMENCNPATSPMDPNVKLQKLPEGESYPEIQRQYQSIVGGSMFAAMNT